MLTRIINNISCLFTTREEKEAKRFWRMNQLIRVRDFRKEYFSLLNGGETMDQYLIKIIDLKKRLKEFNVPFDYIQMNEAVFNQKLKEGKIKL